MQCDISVLRDMRNELTNTANEAKALAGEVSSAGESFTLSALFFEDLARNVKNPQEMINRFKERIESLSKPFHIVMRKELGEEVNVEINGKEKKYYVMSSSLIQRDGTKEGVQVSLRMAPSDNINNVETFIFDLNSDTSTASVGTAAGTVFGITSILRKGIIKATTQAMAKRKQQGMINAHGDKELKTTLNKMRDVDNILGSRQDRDGNSLKGYDKVQDYTHGNIDSMREMMGKLHVLGNSKAPSSLITYYNTLLDKMQPRFFNHVDLYLKKNQVDTLGEINLDANTIHIATAKKNVQAVQSEAEVYMHEVIHSMTSWAFRQKVVNVGGIRTALNKAMEVAKQHVKWQDFLNVPTEDATSRQIEQAKDLYAYAFSSKNNIEEFMAFSLTNPMLMKRLQEIKLSDAKVNEPKTMFGRLSSLFVKAMNLVLGKFNLKDNDITIFEEVNSLTFGLAKVNQKARHDLSQMNPIGHMMEILEDSESYVAQQINKFLKKFKSDDFVQTSDVDSLYQRAKLFIAMVTKGMTNKTYRGALGLWASAYGLTPTGSVREFFSGLFERDSGFRIAEKLGLVMAYIDSGRNTIINATSQQIAEAFKVPLTDDEDTALTRVLLDTNLTSLRYTRTGTRKRNDSEMVSLLTDEAYRYEREGRVKHQILKTLSKDDERGRWTVAQAISLGYLMATGKGNEATNLNAESIVRGFGTNERYEPNQKLAVLVSELATLEAIRHVAVADKNLVARLIKEEPKGVNLISDMYEGYKRTSKQMLFKQNSHHMIEGHTKELFDDSIDIKIAPVSERTTLEAEGYTLRYPIVAAKGVRQSVQMAVYTTEAWGKAERLRGAVALGKLHSRGTTLSNIKMMEDPELGRALFQRDFASVYNTTLEMHEAMREGTYDVTKIKNGLIPIYNEKGTIVDYRYMMDKSTKQNLLKQDLRASQVLPRSMASIEYQVRTDAANAEALRAIKEDMANNWVEGEIGEDSFTEYMLIGPETTDEDAKQIYNMLPPNFIAFINSRKDKTMAVRKDLVRIYFGGSHLRATDMPGIKLLPGFIKSVINGMEGTWMELIKISKGAILIKMPLVLVNNIITNIWLQINQGAINIPQLIRDYKESLKEVNEYISYTRKSAKLEQEIIQAKESLRRVKNSKALQDIIGSKTVELNRLRNAMAQNPAAELFDAGYYQSHTEDLENSALSDTNKLSKMVNGKMQKLPPVVRGAAEIAYLTQNTSWYKVSQEVLQRSDMVARLVDTKQKTRAEIMQANGLRRLPLWWVEQKGDNYNDRQELTGNERKEFLTQARAVRMQAVLDNYVNYTLPNGNIEEYLNRMGLLMFTKYYKRIQSVVLNTTITNPIKSSILVMASLAGVKIETIQDQAMLTRMFDGNGDFSPSSILPTSSPLNHIMNVFTPAIVKEEHLGGLF